MSAIISEGRRESVQIKNAMQNGSPIGTIELNMSKYTHGNFVETKLVRSSRDGKYLVDERRRTRFAQDVAVALSHIVRVVLTDSTPGAFKGLSRALLRPKAAHAWPLSSYRPTLVPRARIAAGIDE